MKVLLLCFLLFFSSNWDNDEDLIHLDSLVAERAYEKALKHIEALDTSLYTDDRKIRFFYLKGQVEKSLGNNKKALQSFRNGLTILGASNISDQAFDFYYYLCILSRDLHHFELSIDYIRKGRKIAQALENKTFIYESYFLESNAYNACGKLDSALTYMSYAKAYLSPTDFYRQGTVENNLASLYMTNKNFELAYEHIMSAEQSYNLDETVPLSIMNQLRINKAFCLLNLNKLDKVYNLMSEAFEIAKANDYRYQLANLTDLRIRYLAIKNGLSEIPNLLDMNSDLEHDLIDSTVHDLSIKYNVQFKDSIISDQDDVIVETEQALSEQALISKNRLRGLVTLSLVFAVAALFFAQYSKNQKINHQLLVSQETIKKQEALQAERSRIAGEMHDDLGSGLTRIKFLSQRMLKNISDIEQKSKLTKIIDNSQSLVSNMSEIIWAMNAGFDNVDSVVAYCRRYAKEYLTDYEIRLVYDNLMGSEKIEFTGERRRHLFLVFKELLHNIVKHSEASVVEIQWKIIDKDIMLSIVDNGVGFELDAFNTGNGLNNMKQRIVELGGIIEWVSEDGTQTHISIPTSKRTQT